MHYDPICKCETSHKGIQACIEPSCHAPNPFESNLCRKKMHTRCQMIPYQNLIQRFQKIQGLGNVQYRRFEQKVQKLFQQLMENLKRQFLKFKQYFAYRNITSPISNIYEKIKSHQQNQLTGSLIASALKDAPPAFEKIQLKNQLDMRMLKKKILQFHESALQSLPVYYSFTQRINVTSLEGTQVNKIRNIYEHYTPNRIQRMPKGMLGNYFEDFQKLLGRYVYSAYIIYRASQNNFSARQFHKKCDGYSNTLTIAHTQFGKLIGGFCPFPWQSDNHWTYYEDNKNDCFLFSTSKILQQKKIVVVNKRKNFAIGMHKDYGPCFGEDLIIYDHASTSKNCWSNFPDVYGMEANGTLLQHSKQMLKQVIGSSDHFQKFGLIEWEVYHICFSRSEERQEIFQQEFKKI